MSTPVWWFERARASRFARGYVLLLVPFITLYVVPAWGVGPALATTLIAWAVYYGAWWSIDRVHRARTRA